MTAPRSLTEAWSLDLSPATTSAPFITLLRGALLPAANFNAWLHNDYIYVHAHAHLLAQLIAALPAASHLRPLLTGGYTVLHSELSLFRSKASSRGVSLPDLPAPRQDPAAEAGRSPADVLAALAPVAADACRRYMAFLMGLCSTTTHWTGLLAVLWACERVYLDAMVSVRGGAAFADGRLDEGIRGFVEWWSSAEFVEYVEALEREAVGVRGGEEGWREEETKALVVQVVELEIGFWGIATEGL